MVLVQTWLLFSLLTIFLQATGEKSHIIIGGHDAKPGEFPYMVSIQLNSGLHECGGSIISDEWILSAAHCFFRYEDPFLYTVLTGTVELYSKGGKRYWLKKIILHPHFHGKMINDIALLQLRNKISFDSSTYKTNLPTRDTSSGTKVVLTGWGMTSYYKSKMFSATLKTIVLVTITNQKCQDAYDTLINNSVRLTDQLICTFTKIGAGACHGDSGGPLVDPNLNIQVGIIKGGKSCAIGIPDYFTRIYEYLDWINNEISEC